MFSGIVAGTFPIRRADKSASGLSLEVEVDSQLSENLQQGMSVSVNGVCLTLVQFSAPGHIPGWMGFDVVPESSGRSNLATLKVGSLVNLERSLKFGDEVGGHLCSGHVDGMVSVTKIVPIGQGAEIHFSIDPLLSRFVLEKGYIALNGASLTVASKTQNAFSVAFIPETLARTNLGALQVGDLVNLEVDRATQAIVETVERVLSK